jgi:hypothetical protein
MPNEARVRELARQILLAGRLPRGDPDRTWGGSGGGEACAVCGQPVMSTETEYEIQFVRPNTTPDRFSLHIRCFAAWEMERTKLP